MPEGLGVFVRLGVGERYNLDGRQLEPAIKLEHHRSWGVRATKSVGKTVKPVRNLNRPPLKPVSV
jgi:hypothetical protein